jgi:hypothetical protein
MNRSRFLGILLYIVISIQVLSLFVVVSGNRPHGRAADQAFSRWLSARTPENEKNFHQEMDRLDENARRIRRYSAIVFCVNTLFLIALLAKGRHGPKEIKGDEANATN